MLLFFPVKTKSVRETDFCCFLPFFSRMEIHFHACILQNFHGQSKIFTVTLSVFFTGTLDFFTGRKEKIFTDGILFSRAEILSPVPPQARCPPFLTSRIVQNNPLGEANFADSWPRFCHVGIMDRPQSRFWIFYSARICPFSTVILMVSLIFPGSIAGL